MDDEADSPANMEGRTEKWMNHHIPEMENSLLTPHEICAIIDITGKDGRAASQTTKTPQTGTDARKTNKAKEQVHEHKHEHEHENENDHHNVNFHQGSNENESSDLPEQNAPAPHSSPVFDTPNSPSPPLLDNSTSGISPVYPVFTGQDEMKSAAPPPLSPALMAGETEGAENEMRDKMSVSTRRNPKIRQRVTINGQEYWVWGETQQEVFDAYRSKLEQINEMERLAKLEDQQTIPTLRQFVIDTYEPTFISNLAPKTVESYTEYLKLNIFPYLGDMRLDEIKVTTIQAFYDWMATGASHGRKRNLNKNTITRVSGLLGRIFRVAKEMGLIADTPIKRTLLKINAEEGGHHKALPDAEIDRIKREIPKLENEDERLFMALLAFSGMRPEEVYGLRWEDVYLSESYAMVRRAVTYPGKSHPHIGHPKTASSQRTVLFPAKVIEILRPLQKPCGFILGGESPWCYSTKERVAKRAFQHLNIHGYTCYDFRTTFGTQLKERGQTSAIIADLMGHADTRMVETVYARRRHEGVMKFLKDVEGIS